MSIIPNVIKPFFEEPTKEFNVRQIARLLKISPSTASKKLKALKKETFLKKKNIGIYNFYKANIDSENYRDLKVYYNIRKLKDSGLIEELNKFYILPTIILYGSVSSGYDTENSDIDLVIITEKRKDFEKTEYFNKKLSRELQLFVVRNLKELRNEHLVANVMQGIVLQGEIRWNWKNVMKGAL